MMQRTNIEEVKPFRGHRRVKSSGARLPSMKEIQGTDKRTDDRSSCTYQIPHLFGPKGTSHESSLSDFRRRCQADNISSTDSHSQQSRLSQSSISGITSNIDNKDVICSSKISLKKSQTFAFSSSTKDELRKKLDMDQRTIFKAPDIKRSPKVASYKMKKSQTFTFDSSTKDGLRRESDWIRLNQKMNSFRFDGDEVFSPKVAGYKMKKCLSHISISMENNEDDQELGAVGMKEWSLETQLERFSSMLALKKDTKEERNVLSLSDDEDTIEIFQSDKVVKQDIKSRNHTKGATKKQKSKKNDRKQIKATKELPKPEWLQRGKSDSSESRKTQESKEMETRMNLISKIRRNRLKFFGRGTLEPTSKPLASLSHCSKDEDISTQVRNQSVFLLCA